MDGYRTLQLETERLILRKFTSQDAQALLSILGDQEVNTFLPMFPLKTIEEAKTCLQQYLDDYDRGDGYRYAVCLKKDNIPIGYVHVSGEKSHDFGYGLKKEFWHRGIITEASQAVVDQLRRDGLPYITATHDVNNPRSGEVMKRIGMKYQYSYKEQWQPKNILVTFRMYQLNLDGNEGRIYWEYWERYPVHFVESGL